MTERELQGAIIDAARLLGWRVCHFRPARTLNGWRTPIEGHPGFPDLVLLRPPRLIFAELREAGCADPGSGALAERFPRSGPQIETYEWRPVNWESGEIEEILR